MKERRTLSAPEVRRLVPSADLEIFLTYRHVYARWTRTIEHF